MTKLELEYILQEGESYLVEFKEKVKSSLSRELTAFSNASGGRIFIGVDDYGKIKGISNSNKIKSQIQDIANNCQPSIEITITPSNTNNSFNNFKRGIIIQSHLSCLVKSSIATSLPSHSLIIGLFTLSLYAQPSFPVL